MDRKIILPGTRPASADVLQIQQNIMVSLGEALEAMLGTTGAFLSGLTCAANADGTVTVGPGSMTAYEQLEATAFGSLPADTQDLLLKMGIGTSSVILQTPAPTTSGDSLAYLIEVQFQEADGTPLVLPYFNPASTTNVFAGPGGTGTAQNTVRAQQVVIQAKAGLVAATGSESVPAPDSGWIGIYQVITTEGTTTPVVSSYGPPMLAGLLQSHHNGAPGQAPKVILTNGEEVQGILPVANGGVGASLGFTTYHVDLSNPPAKNNVLYPGDKQIVTFSGAAEVSMYCDCYGTNSFSPGGVYRVSVVFASVNQSDFSDVAYIPNAGITSSAAYTTWCAEPSDAGNTTSPYINGTPQTVLISRNGYWYLDTIYNNSSTDPVNDHGPLILDMVICTRPAAKMLICRSGTTGGSSLIFGSTQDSTEWSGLGVLALTKTDTTTNTVVPDTTASSLTGTIMIERLA